MNVPETFFSVEEELFLFFASCLCGVFIGAYYDIFRAFRMLVPHKSVLVIIEDLVFLGSYGIFLSAFANAAARGELRFYYIIGNAIGAALYFFTIGTFVMRTLGKLLCFLKKIAGIILTPLKSLYALLYRKAAAKFVGSSKIFVKLYKKLKFLLQRMPIMLYNKMESKMRKNVKKVGKKKTNGKKSRKAENKKAKVQKRNV